MRTVKIIFYFFAIIACMGIFASCSKKDGAAPNYNSDKTAFKSVIDSLTNVYNSTNDGTHPGQYTIGSRAALDSVLALAGQVYTGSYTQEQVNDALLNLRKAGQVFSTKLLQEVSVANLMALWKFNGNTVDSSGHGHDGMLKTGWTGSSATTVVDGGTLPVLVADRFGRPGMAYNFDNGATIEVPYDKALNPQNLTISAWVKRHTTNSNNYILSLNRWNGYKFQLQSNNFLFFTLHDSNNGYHDVDDNPGTVPQDIWTHCVVSYTNGAMKFYINGVLQKTVVVTGTPITVAGVNLAIGNELPKSGYNVTDSNDPNYYYGGDFFIGSLDDIRFYNTALSDAEVLSIYTQESSL